MKQPDDTFHRIGSWRGALDVAVKNAPADNPPGRFRWPERVVRAEVEPPTFCFQE
jgi:hypothetical protein